VPVRQESLGLLGECELSVREAEHPDFAVSERLELGRPSSNPIIFAQHHPARPG